MEMNKSSVLLPLVGNFTNCSPSMSAMVSRSIWLVLLSQVLPIMALVVQSMSGRLASPAIHSVDSALHW